MNEREVNTLIVGAGYSGLNTYYAVNKEAHVVSMDNVFKFRTAELRKIVNTGIKSEVPVPFVAKNKVLDIDVSSRLAVLEGEKIYAENLVITPGCLRSNWGKVIENALSSSYISLGTEDEKDEYLLLQLAFYLKKIGKNVRIQTSYLKWLGEPVESIVRSLADQVGISYTERPEFIIEECVPSHPFSFYQPNEFMEIADRVYVAGDIVKGWPKLGELAMRTGMYVGKRINGFSRSFEPIFIFILDAGNGFGLHIRSNKPWGGNLVSVKGSRIRPLLKRFIERYYIWTKGRMGFLVNL